MQTDVKKKPGIAILTSDKMHFKTKTETRDKEHYIIIKRIIQQEDTTIANICAPTMEAPKYIKQLIINIKELIDANKIILGDINIILISMDKSAKQKINKETVALNDNWTDGFNRYIQNISS